MARVILFSSPFGCLGTIQIDGLLPLSNAFETYNETINICTEICNKYHKKYINHRNSKEMTSRRSHDIMYDNGVVMITNVDLEKIEFIISDFRKELGRHITLEKVDIALYYTVSRIESDEDEDPFMDEDDTSKQVNIYHVENGKIVLLDSKVISNFDNSLDCVEDFAKSMFPYCEADIREL